MQVIGLGEGRGNETGPECDVESSQEHGEEGESGVFIAEDGPCGDVVFIGLEARFFLIQAVVVVFPALF
jgi:hypothetical protein